MKYFNFKASVFFIFILIAPPCFSQSSQQIEIQEDALRLLGEAEANRLENIDRYSHINGGPVTLAEVMRDPDNIELNYRYAQTQVADGNLRGAGATLERILLLNPDITKVRLFYAHVLYRLDNIREMQEQLNILEGISLSSDDQEEVMTLRKRASRRLKATNLTATLTAGLSYQSNANFAPDSGFNDVIVPTPLGTFIGEVPLDSPEEDDISYIGSASLNLTHDLGHQEGHFLFGSLSTYWNEQVTVDTSDHNTFAGNAGVRYFAPWAEITGQFLAGHFTLDDDSFLNYYAFDVNLQRDFLNGVLSTNLRHRTTYENYDVADNVSRERTGPRHEFEAGADYRLTRNQLIGGSLIYTNKNADSPWREFDGLDISLYHTWIISRGIYIRNAFEYGFEDYDAPNPRVSLLSRKDDNFRYRFSISSTLRRLFSGFDLPGAIGDIRLNASLRYTRTDSNIQNYEYDNVRADLLFSKRFDLF